MKRIIVTFPTDKYDWEVIQQIHKTFEMAYPNDIVICIPEDIDVRILPGEDEERGF